MSCTVSFLGELGGELTVPVLPGKTLLESATAGKVPMLNDCGGRARCTTCRVRLVEGVLPGRTPDEAEIARMLNWPEDIRLACQVCPESDVRVERLMRLDLQRDKWLETQAGERSQELPLAVLFCDINGFTEFASERMPYDVVHVVNRMFLRIGEAVLANSGYIDKYLGDGLLALWGVEGGEPHDHVLNAVRAALLMQHAIRDISGRMKTHFGSALSLRVGIHFGPAIIGRIGHPARQQLTAIGDTVNIASRVEAQNKELLTNMLITEECYTHVRDEVVIGDDFKTVLRGQNRPRRLYEVTGLKHPDPVFLVQRQIHQVLLNGNRFVERFYHHFFEGAPDLRALFHGTVMPRQHEMFLNQIVWTVRELRNLPQLLQNLGDLGERHRVYGVQRQHFPIAGAALLLALEETLGEAFDAESRAAWSTAFNSLASAMQGTAA